MQNKKVIYTAIFSNKNPIDLPRKFKKIEGWDYILFTNMDLSKYHTHWNIIRCPNYFSSNVLTSKYIKWIGWYFLRQYDILVWIDGNMEICYEKKDKFLHIVSQLNDEIYVLFKKHPKRNCIYEECNAIIEGKKDICLRVNENKKIFEKEKMPSHNGLIEGGIIIYKNTQVVHDFFRKVFLFMVDKSHRDQISIPYIIWKNNIHFYKVLDYIELEEIYKIFIYKEHSIINY